MPDQATINEQPVPIADESNEGQEEERTKSLTLPTFENLRPRYRRYCSEHVSSDEMSTLPAKRDLIQEMYLRSKQQYKQCLSNDEQCVSEA